MFRKKKPLLPLPLVFYCIKTLTVIVSASIFNREISLEEKGEFYRTFRGFRVFVFRYRVKSENAEMAKSFLYHILSQVTLP